MNLPGALGTLTYCMNVHPTQTLEQIRAALAGPVAGVRARAAPGAEFAIGLRIPAAAMDELDRPGAREAFGAHLAAHDLRPVTMNGFPYGPFHGTRVKSEVYRPDWRSHARLDYTVRLADLMAALNPEGAWLSLSTVPGAFKPDGHGAEELIAETYLRAVAHLARLEAETGRCVALAIEPEPYCLIETIAEAVSFFGRLLYGDAARRRVAELSGLEAGPDLIPRHLGLCYDVCHAAVEFEDVAGSLSALAEVGIPVHKLQLSSALRIASGSDAMREALAAFDEPTYLHQLVSRRPDGRITRFADLHEALGPDGAPDGEEWRVHFHVPLFLEATATLSTTQDFLREVLALHKRAPISPHLEVETYTWDVMPADLRSDGLEADIARELDWVVAELTG